MSENISCLKDKACKNYSYAFPRRLAKDVADVAQMLLLMQIFPKYSASNQDQLHFKARRLFNSDMIFAPPPFEAGFHSRQAFIQGITLLIESQSFA